MDQRRVEEECAHRESSTTPTVSVSVVERARDPTPPCPSYTRKGQTRDLSPSLPSVVPPSTTLSDDDPVYPWPLEPWFKLDFIFPSCACPGCCPIDLGGLISRSNAEIDAGRGAGLAKGLPDNPFFSFALPSMARPALRLEDLVAHLHLPTDERFVVNIGAACGLRGFADPTQPLLAGAVEGLGEPFAALLVDSMKHTAALFSAYPMRENITIVPNVLLEPATLVSVLEEQGVPLNFGVLKVDIDSMDLGLIFSALSAGYRPAVLYAEINTAFPPPLRFTVPLDMSAQEQESFGVELWKLPTLFGGTSLASAHDALRPFGYHLVEIDGFDAMWVHSAYVGRLPSHRLPTSLATAFAQGCKERILSAPQCFLPQLNPRVFHPELWALADEAEAAERAGDKNALDAVLLRLRGIVDAVAPKHPVIDHCRVSLLFRQSISHSGCESQVPKAPAGKCQVKGLIGVGVGVGGGCG